MKPWLFAVLALALQGCVSVTKIDGGQRTVGNRLAVKIDGAWNQINAPGLAPTEVWTMEGLAVDRLTFYAGVKDGQPVEAERTAAGAVNRKSFVFRSAMQPDEIATLFEGVMTRDGSTYRLLKLEPSGFGGDKGFRFEYLLTRKGDNVTLLGLGYGTVRKGELYAMLYMAPRLAFFPRHVAQVEAIARSAVIRD